MSHGVEVHDWAKALQEKQPDLRRSFTFPQDPGDAREGQ